MGGSLFILSPDEIIYVSWYIHLSQEFYFRLAIKRVSNLSDAYAFSRRYQYVFLQFIFKNVTIYFIDTH